MEFSYDDKHVYHTLNMHILSLITLVSTKYIRLKPTTVAYLPRNSYCFRMKMYSLIKHYHIRFMHSNLLTIQINHRLIRLG